MSEIRPKSSPTKLLLRTILGLLLLAIGIYTLTRRSSTPPVAPSAPSATGSDDLIPTTQATTPPATAPSVTETPVITPTPPSATPPAAGASISSLAFARDGRLLVARTGAIEFRDLATGARQPLAIQATMVRDMSISPDGGTVAVNSGASTVLYSVVSESGREVTNAPVQCVRFSTDGRTLASGHAGGEVRLWDAISCANSATLHTGVGEVNDLAFAPDRRSLAVAGAQGVVIWDVSGNRIVKKLVNDACSSLAYSPDGHVLVTATANGVALWEPVFWQKQATLATGTSVRRVAFWRGGSTIVTSCADGSIQLWDTPTRQRTVTLPADGPLAALAISPDDRTLATAGTKGLLIWDTTTRASRPLP